MKHKTILCLVLCLLLLVVTVKADGFCELDKEMYHPGETGYFSCSCTLLNEENIDGYISFVNSSGGVLQNLSVNSGLCRTSFFGSSIIFPNGGNNYTGNVTFEVEDASWQAVGDIVNDSFNVSGAHITDCEIVDVEGSTSITLGRTGAVKFHVIDGITGDPLIHMSCQAEGFSLTGGPILFEPEGSGDDMFKKTTADGEVGFLHLMDEKIWEPDTTYLFHFHCFSLPNNTFSQLDHIAFDQETGLPVGLKSCSLTTPFTTGPNDFRLNPIQDSSSSISISLFILLITMTLFVLSFFKLSDNTFVDLILKRGLLIISIFMMLMNSGIMLTFAENANLGIDSLIVRYMWLLGWTGYTTIFITFVSTIFSIAKRYRDHKFNERMGGDNHD